MNSRQTDFVPTQILHSFASIGLDELRTLDNNSKAKYGKKKFLQEVPGTLDASARLVREWLESHGLKVQQSDWVEVQIAPDLAPRQVNQAYSTRSVDAFIDRPEEGRLGCELKVSGEDGVAGLTVSEERLIRKGLLRVFAVNPVRGLIGEMERDALLRVPRRLDGIPIGEARVQWVGSEIA